jgi:hypothetical protein
MSAGGAPMMQYVAPFSSGTGCVVIGRERGEGAGKGEVRREEKRVRDSAL